MLSSAALPRTGRLLILYLDDRRKHSKQFESEWITDSYMLKVG